LNWCIASQALPPFTATPTSRRAMPPTYDRRPPADVRCVTIESHLGPTFRGRPTAITDHVALRSTPITPIEGVPVLWRDEEPISDAAGLEDSPRPSRCSCLKDWAWQPQSSQTGALPYSLTPLPRQRIRSIQIARKRQPDPCFPTKIAITRSSRLIVPTRLSVICFLHGRRIGGRTCEVPSAFRSAATGPAGSDGRTGRWHLPATGRPPEATAPAAGWLGRQRPEQACRCGSRQLARGRASLPGW
jgi:hypothetical protein